LEKKELPGNLLLCSALAFFLAYFEYYYVTFNGVPYREMYQSSSLSVPPYLLFPVAPAIALTAILPIINNLVTCHDDSVRLNRTITMSLANLLWALTLYDISYYSFRSVFPMLTDPLGGCWITVAETPFLGLVGLLGVLWPTWYFATMPVAFSVYVAYYIS
jgi:hypothetical protein